MGGWSRARSPRFSIACAAIASFGCTELAPGSDTARSPIEVPPPGWECLAEEPSRPAITPRPQYVIYSAPIVDLATQGPVPNLTVQVCLVGDTDCKMEAGRVIGPNLMQVEGVDFPVPIVTLVVPFGFSIYIRMTAPEYLRQEYYFGGPLIGSPGGGVVKPPELMGATATLMEGLPLTPVKETDADFLANQIGLTRDPSQAIIAVRTIGCAGLPTAGVTLSLDLAKGVSFTYKQGFALGSSEPTDTNGLAGFANVELPNDVPLYNVKLEGIAEGKANFGSTAFTVRPNQMTTGEIRPFSTLYGR